MNKFWSWLFSMFPDRSTHSDVHVTNLKFESDRIALEWEGCAPLLHEIVQAAADNFPPRCSHARITSIFRTIEENSAVGAKTQVHCQTPHRACDIGAAELTSDEIKAICKAVNARYIYDPQRSEYVVAYGDHHGTGQHIHAQCHPRTEWR